MSLRGQIQFLPRIRVKLGFVKWSSKSFLKGPFWYLFDFKTLPFSYSTTNELERSDSVLAQTWVFKVVIIPVLRGTFWYVFDLKTLPFFLIQHSDMCLIARRYLFLIQQQMSLRGQIQLLPRIRVKLGLVK